MAPYGLLLRSATVYDTCRSKVWLMKRFQTSQNKSKMNMQIRNQAERSFEWNCVMCNCVSFSWEKGFTKNYDITFFLFTFQLVLQRPKMQQMIFFFFAFKEDLWKIFTFLETLWAISGNSKTSWVIIFKLQVPFGTFFVHFITSVFHFCQKQTHIYINKITVCLCVCVFVCPTIFL